MRLVAGDGYGTYSLRTREGGAGPGVLASARLVETSNGQ